MVFVRFWFCYFFPLAAEMKTIRWKGYHWLSEKELEVSHRTVCGFRKAYWKYTLKYWRVYRSAVLLKHLGSAVKRSFKHIVVLKYYQMLTVYWFESHPSLFLQWMSVALVWWVAYMWLYNDCTDSECSDILVQSWGSKGFRDYYKKQK